MGSPSLCWGPCELCSLHPPLPPRDPYPHLRCFSICPPIQLLGSQLIIGVQLLGGEQWGGGLGTPDSPPKTLFPVFLPISIIILHAPQSPFHVPQPNYWGSTQLLGSNPTIGTQPMGGGLLVPYPHPLTPNSVPTIRSLHLLLPPYFCPISAVPNPLPRSPTQLLGSNPTIGIQPNYRDPTQAGRLS